MITEQNTANHRVVIVGGGFGGLFAARKLRASGYDEWSEIAPGLKTVEHALRMRRKTFYAFETAELIDDHGQRAPWLNFVVVGAGPTGVELAGAIAELAHRTMVDDFRRLDPQQARILLVEGADRVLPGYPEKLSRKAEGMLAELGVEILTSTMASDIDATGVCLNGLQGETRVPSRTGLWAAGVRASVFGAILADRTQAARTADGRLQVAPDLSLAHYPDIFVIGDLAASVPTAAASRFPGSRPPRFSRASMWPDCSSAGRGVNRPKRSPTTIRAAWP